MLSMLPLSCDCSLDKIEQETTGLETPQALPKATLDVTKTYGTFYLMIRCMVL